MRRHFVKFIYLLPLTYVCITADGAMSQTLQLFEETDVNDTAQRENRPGLARRDNEGNLVTGPEFTLVGTSRIGASYIVVLEDRENEIISTTLSEGSTAVITDYPEFTIVGISAGVVSVEYPSGLDCIEYNSQGVTCSSPRTARLSLTNAAPLAIQNRTTNSLNLNESNATEDIMSNPFEALLERAADPGAETPVGSFEPVRINPSDVPPGMRVVSTPFGDRLVEED